MPTLLIAAALASAPFSPIAIERNADLIGTTIPADVWPPALAEMPWPAAADAPDAMVVRAWSTPLDRRFEWLLVAWSVLGEADSARPVGSLTLTWADGRTLAEDLRVGTQISRLDAAATAANTPILPLGEGRGLSLHVVRNPRPDVPVATLAIKSGMPSARLAVFAVATAEGPLPFPVASIDPVPAGFLFPWGPLSPAAPQPEPTRVVGPAGAHGFVTVRDGHLAFQNGGRVRFWGVNLLNAASLPPTDVAGAFADHLAGAGVNLVRIHHVDSNFAGLVPAARRKGDPLFDPEALDRLDRFVSELGKRGIYVLLEIATQRALTAADGVQGADARIPNGHKLLPMFDPAWGDALEAWARAWLGRTNPYTGLRYADDPTVAMVELGNEHSLVATWLSGGLEKLPAAHRAVLQARWNDFLRRRYGTDEAIAAAWKGSVNEGLTPGESLGSIRREPVSQAFFDNWPEARVRDLAAFHMELEEAFFTRMGAVVRELGYRVPIIGTVTFHQPALAELLRRYDVIDNHFEWDAGSSRNDSIVSSPRTQSMVEYLDDAQLDRPFIVSEISHAYPNDQAAEGPLVWATLASVQDWDALVWLHYANGPWDPAPNRVAGGFDLRGMVTSWAQSAVASAVFRSAVVPPAPGLWVNWRSPEAVRDALVAGDRPSFPETRDIGFVLSHRLREAYGPTAPPPGFPGTPGAEVGWWVEAGLLVLDTESAQAVVGRHDRAEAAGRGEGAGPTHARFLEAKLDGFAAVSLVSVDGGALSRGGPAVLTVAGRTLNDGSLRTGGGTTLLAWGGAPAQVVRPAGYVRFAWPARPIVRAVAPDGTRGDPLPVRRDGKGWWRLELVDPTLWWEITSA